MRPIYEELKKEQHSTMTAIKSVTELNNEGTTRLFFVKADDKNPQTNFYFFLSVRKKSSSHKTINKYS